MLGLVVAELVLLAVLTMVLIVAHGSSLVRDRGRRRRRAVAWQFLAYGVAQLGETITLIALATGNTPPLWIFVIGYGVMNLVMIGWLALLVRARRRT